MAIGIAEVDAAPTPPVIELHVLTRPGRASIFEAGILDAAENRVEFLVTDVECIMVPSEMLAIVKIQRQRFIHPHGREMAGGALVFEAKNLGKETSRGLFVVSRHYGVIQRNSHLTISAVIRRFRGRIH